MAVLILSHRVLTQACCTGGVSPRRRSSRRFEDTGERDLAADMLDENEQQAEETDALFREVAAPRRGRPAQLALESDDEEEPRPARARAGPAFAQASSFEPVRAARKQNPSTWPGFSSPIWALPGCTLAVSCPEWPYSYSIP